ncbi:hypothetical protein PTI98_007404 [Pleurotus ostreatus]|nr:hypothetical protein PTI98_007404 [Pleurotus ostreatus]
MPVDTHIQPESFSFARIHGGHYTVVNSRTEVVPTPPATMIHYMEDDLSIFKQPNWLTNMFPYLALIPKHHSWSGPLFQPLHVSLSSLKFWKTRDGCYVLVKTTRDTWRALEYALQRFIKYLLNEVRGVSSSFAFYSFPSQYGYSFKHPTPEEARDCCMQSRDAFLPLIALATFCVILAERHERALPTFRWRDFVSSAARLHPQFIADLEASVIGSTHALRQGGFIDINTCDFLDDIPSLFPYNMPLYFYWGPENKTPYPPLPYADFPWATGVAQRMPLIASTAIFKGRPVSPSAPSDPSSGAKWGPPPSPIASSSAVPSFVVDQGTSQRPGELMSEFFARREKHFERYVLKETQTQRQARLAREEAASHQQIPGRRGALVFYWEDVDGIRIRRFGTRDPSLWLRYSHNQRRYNSAFDEWDLCSEFAPEEGASELGDYDDSDDDDIPHADPAADNTDVRRSDDIDASAIPSAFTIHLDDDPLLSSMTQRGPNPEMRHLYSLDQESAPLDSDLASEMPEFSALQVAYEIFGFTDSEEDQGQSSGSQVDWALVKKCMGVSWKDVGGYVDAKTVSHLCKFFLCLTTASSWLDMPQGLLDIRQADSIVSSYWMGDIPFHLEPNGDAVSYVFGSSARLQVVVTNPLAVLYVARCHRDWDSHSVSTVATNLAGIGFPFSLRLSTGAGSVPMSTSEGNNALGYRPANYIPNKWDYCAYVTRRDALLKSPRGCSALMTGGLVGRMARALIPPDFFSALLSSEDIDPALFSPLTSAELDLICGVYCQETGQVSSKGEKQVTRKSWWPPHHLWVKQQFGLAQWTNDAEAWYQRRHEKLSSGNFEAADLMNGPSWRSALRHTPAAKKLISQMEGLAAAYIRSRMVL